MGARNAEFYADFKIVAKVLQKCFLKILLANFHANFELFCMVFTIFFKAFRLSTFHQDDILRLMISHIVILAILALFLNFECKFSKN